MDDIRNIKKINKIYRTIKIKNFFNNLKKKWFKILLILIFILICIFPGYLGQAIGWWWNEFALSFLQKITY